MQYSNIDGLPDYVKKYSIKVQRQWMHVLNTTHDNTQSDVRSMKAANSVLKKRFEKTTSDENYHTDRFHQQVDKWLGNLNG